MSYVSGSELKINPIMGERQAMRLYIFKSEKRSDLHAFADDARGSKLPANHGPWTATGIVGQESAPPHNFSRGAIEEAMATKGFQLWRKMKKAGANA